MSDLEEMRREVRQRLIKENEFPHIPDDWGVERLRFLFTESKERNGKSPVGDMLSVSEYRGVVPREYEHEEQRRTDEELENYRVVRPGQLAVNSMWLNHLGLGVSEHTGHVSPAYSVYDISDRLDRRFIHHLMRSNYYLKIYLRYLYGIRPNSFQIKSNDWASIPIIVPNLETQRQIADFLDNETARIDLLIEMKQRLVDAIKAKISDFADLAVTQGLNAKSQMKQVDLPWIDAIPSHWAVIRGKYLFQQMSRPPRDDDEVITAFRDGQVCLRSRRRTEGYTFAELEVGYQHIKRGDLVIHTMDAFAGAIGVSEDDGKSTGEYAVCKPIGDHNTTYFAYLLRCMAKRDYISVLCPSVRERAPRFRFVRFAPVFLPVPPREEQNAIVDAIEQMRSRLSIVQTKTIASIDRLKEYRSALITAAVTGQIDVQTYAKSGTPDRRLDAIQEEMGT